MLTIGGWTFGVSRTDRRLARHQADDREQQAHDHREHRTADRDVGEDHVVGRSRARWAVGGCVGLHAHRHAVAHIQRAVDDDAVVGRQPFQNFDFARAGAGRS